MFNKCLAPGCAKDTGQADPYCDAHTKLLTARSQVELKKHLIMLGGLRASLATRIGLLLEEQDWPLADQLGFNPPAGRDKHPEPAKPPTPAVAPLASPPAGSISKK
jgi:hypothetical protein